MTIFNSLGSNYNLRFVLKALFARNKEGYKSDLTKFLEKKYAGKAILVYKGREAIELALEILKDYFKSLYSSSDPSAEEESRSLPQVAINGFTCFAVYKAIETAGYEAVCLDLDPSDDGLDLNFSANELLQAIKQNPKIKVVIIQNTLGYPCEAEKIAKICKDNNLILIEDLAHSVGTTYANGKEAGTIGDFVVLSFSQDKIIDAVSGGAIIIRNKKYSNLAIQQFNNVNNYQQLRDRFYPLLTYKIRITYKIGLGKLLHFILKSLNLLSKPMNDDFYTKYDLPNWYSYLIMDSFAQLNRNLKHRRKIASIYNSILDKRITSDYINKNILLSSNLRYPIFVENRKALIEYLKKEDVYVSDVWYDSVSKDSPNCQTIADKILNLPTHKNISTNDAKLLANKINQWLQSQ